MQDLDLITVGRCCVDLYGQQVGARLQDTETFRRSVGGSPTNTAIGAARLGLRVGVVTAVGNEQMGGFIREQLAREGICLDGVKVDPRRLTAIVMLGMAGDESFPHVFFRENCADMALAEEDLDPRFIARARALLVSGTHFSTPAVSAMSFAAIRMARANASRVVLDIDFRPTLWNLAGHDAGEERSARSPEATARLQSILPQCDLVVGTEEELAIAAGGGDLQANLETIRRLTAATIVCKRGAAGCIVFPDAIGRGLSGGVAGRGFAVEVYNTLGAGDAFMAGFLRGWLRDASLEECCTFANAAGAFAVSRLLCSREYPCQAELDRLIRAGIQTPRLRHDPTLSHLHRAATRRTIAPTIRALAIDHRAQVEAIASEACQSVERIPQFKRLAVAAAARVAAGRPGFGVLIDEKYGRSALFEAAAQGLWIARPVEHPGSRPLRFETDDLGSHMVEWPAAHTVKCLCFYHPDDPPDLRAAQEDRLLALADAAGTVGREYIVEIIAGNHGRLETHTVPTVLSRLYDLGIRPDWWKLEPQKHAAGWRAIEEVIAVRDPACRGVMMLGLDAPEEQLIADMSVAGGVGIVKGFAIGRTVFADVLRSWLMGGVSDEDAVAEMAARFGRLSAAWERAVGGRQAPIPPSHGDGTRRIA